MTVTAETSLARGGAMRRLWERVARHSARHQARERQRWEEALLTKAAGVSSTTLVCHKDTWDFIELYAEDGAGIYAFSRVDRDEKIEHLVALNNAPEERTVTLTALTPGASYSPLYGDHAPVTAAADGTLELTVPSLGAAVLVADQPVAPAGDAQAITLDLADGGKVEGMAPVSAAVAAGCRAGGDTDVRCGRRGPPGGDRVRVGGGVVEPVHGDRGFAARGAGEDAQAGCGISLGGVGRGQVGCVGQ